MGLEGRIRDKIMEGANNNKELMKKHVETYYCKSFHIDIKKCMGSPYNWAIMLLLPHRLTKKAFVGIVGH